MTIFINGEPRKISASHVKELVKELQLHESTVLIEHNGIALHRDEWISAPLRQNDRIEILRVVAGG